MSLSLPLPLEVRRLIVEAAMAAPNYGLMPQAKALLAAFNMLGLDKETRALARAMVYFGLYQPRAALAALKNRKSEEAQALRASILNYLNDIERKKGLSD